MVHQFYETRVNDEFVLRGNSITLKCLIPSFIADFVDVVAWVADDGEEFATNTDYGSVIIWVNYFLIVSQYCETREFLYFYFSSIHVINPCENFR